MNTAKNDEGTASGGAASWEGQDARSTTLHRFEVRVLGETKVSAPVYANNRQRVPIEVIIEVRNADGDLITLPESALRNMRLIDYETGENLSGWYPQKNEYVYEWTPVRENGVGVGGRASGDAAPAPTAQSIMLYMSTGQDLKWVAAEFPLHGTTYRTNTPGAQPGSEEFDSWIKVTGVEPVVHPLSGFVLEGPIHYGSEAGRYDISLYYVRFNDPQYRILGAAREGGLLDQRHFSRSAGGWSDKSHVAYDVDGQRTVEHAPGVSLIVNSRPGQATVARIGTNIAALDRDETPLVHYYDQHGNGGSVRFVSANDGDTILIDGDGNGWVTLQQFELRVLGSTNVNARCYRNNRQQVPIQVIIDARNEHGEQVELTHAQMRGITLCYYDTSYPMGGWSFTKNRYEYNFLPLQDGGDAVAAGDRNGDFSESKAQSIMLYMATTMPSKKIAAKITSPSGVSYYTNTPGAEPGSGKFDSWVNVVGVEAVIHPFSAFAVDRVDHSDSPYIYDIDLYYLRFNYQGEPYHIVESLHLDGYEGDTRHYSWDKDGWMEKCQIAFRVGPEWTFTYGRVSFKVNSRQGQATAVRISSNATHLHIDDKPRVVYYDQYGNAGMVRWVNSSNGNTMHIENAGNPPPDDADDEQDAAVA